MFIDEDSNLKLRQEFFLHLGERLVGLNRKVDTFFHCRLTRNILHNTEHTQIHYR